MFAGRAAGVVRRFRDITDQQGGKGHVDVWPLVHSKAHGRLSRELPMCLGPRVHKL